MLNTKPIKNKNIDMELKINLSSDETNKSNKIVQIENSKQKQLEDIVKQANIDNNTLNEHNNNNQEQIGGIINDAHNNVYIQNSLLNKEFMYDRYKDQNLNISNLIDGGKMLIGNIDKNNVNMVINKSLQLDEATKSDIDIVKWDDIDNCYIFHNKYKIYNENILKYIVNNETNENLIKKYIFIISWNSQIESFEFNFINSIFTLNFDIMIKLQNFIYDTLINFDNLNISDTYNYKESILMFYFQMIIFIFNNYEIYIKNNEQNKILRVCSSFVYRFSSLILKNILKINDNIDENNNLLNKLLLTRADIFSQINFINNKLERLNQNEQLLITETEINTDDDTKQHKIINKKNNQSTNVSDSDNLTNTYNKNVGYKNGKKIKKIKDLFTDELLKIKTNTSIDVYDSNTNTEANNNTNTSTKAGSETETDTETDTDYDSEKNGFFEIDAFADFKKNQEQNHDQDKNNIMNLLKLTEHTNVKKNIPLENSIQSNNKSFTTNKDRSFNPNSALKNSKLYEIPI